jgi:hypothetical protein
MTFPFILISVVLMNSTGFILTRKFILKESINFQFVLHKSVSFFLQSVVSCYTLLISGAVSPLICLKQDDGTSTMVRNPSVLCFSGDWNAKYPVMILFLVLYAAIFPVLFLSLLLWNRKRLNEPSVLQYFGSFTKQYKPKGGCFSYQANTFRRYLWSDSSTSVRLSSVFRMYFPYLWIFVSGVLCEPV